MKPKQSDLEPPDINRCQVESSKYNPWVMGGPVRTWDRCKNTPQMIVRETKPGSDGLRGSMSMCAACHEAFKAQRPAETYTTEPIGDAHG